jgi:hypothetical protein
MRESNCAGSKSVIGAMPLRPLINASHVALLVWPFGVIVPTPVTTTFRLTG